MEEIFKKKQVELLELRGYIYIYIYFTKLTTTD